MNSFSFSSGSRLADLRSSESWMEIGLAVATAAFSVAIWLADERPANALEGAIRVTFPTVIVSATR